MLTPTNKICENIVLLKARDVINVCFLKTINKFYRHREMEQRWKSINSQNQQPKFGSWNTQGQKEKTDSTELSSDLHMRTMTHVPGNINDSNK